MFESKTLSPVAVALGCDALKEAFVKVSRRRNGGQRPHDTCADTASLMSCNSEARSCCRIILRSSFVNIKYFNTRINAIKRDGFRRPSFSPQYSPSLHPPLEFTLHPPVGSLESHTAGDQPLGNAAGFGIGGPAQRVVLAA